MGERPTPEERMHWIDVKLAEITEQSFDSYVLGCVAAVRDMIDDCRIVHPDDVPKAGGWNGAPTIPPGFDMGWNACRAHIFGGDDE